MTQTYTDDAGKIFTATATENTLYLCVPRQPEIVKLKIPPTHRSRLRHAIRRSDFHAFAKVVDMVEG